MCCGVAEFRLALAIVPKLIVRSCPLLLMVADVARAAKPPTTEVVRYMSAVIESTLTIARPAGKESVRTAADVTPSGIVSVT